MTQRNPATNDTAALREAAATLVHGVYRLVKASLFYTDASNDAITNLTTAATGAVAQFCKVAGADAASITFIGDAVFVNGQILKASRETHALTEELRGMLEPCEVTELTFRIDVGRDAFARFARLLAGVSRDKTLAERLRTEDLPGIQARKAVFNQGGTGETETPGARASRTYALSVLTLQRVLTTPQKAEGEHSRLIKRVAQRIVGQVDEDGRLLVALAAVAGASTDPAVIAVASAILAVAMLRQLTTDRSLLANAAAAALLHDAGKAAFAASAEGLARTLNDDELDRVKLRSVVTLTAMGRMHPPARLRTVLVYEAWAQRRMHRTGPPYGGKRAPTMLSRVLSTARAFSELRAADAEAKLSIDDALHLLNTRATDGTERAFVRLLVGALGIYPAGTLVELSTGELAVVMGTPASPVDYVRPPVKILYDSNAILLDKPIDIDLAAPRGADGPLRFIRKNIDADDQQLKAMRSYVLAATAATRRAAEPSDAQSSQGRGVSPSSIVATAPPASAAVGAAAPAQSSSIVTTAPPPSGVAGAVTEPPPRAFPVGSSVPRSGVATAPPPRGLLSRAEVPAKTEPPSSEKSPSRRVPLRPIVPRTDSPFPVDPPSSEARRKHDEPPSVGTSPSRRREERVVLPREDVVPPSSSMRSADPVSSTPRKRELRPIIPRNDTPPPLKTAPEIKETTPSPSPVASPAAIAAEQARAAKMTESMPPTGLRSAIFGGRAPKAAEPAAPEPLPGPSLSSVTDAMVPPTLTPESPRAPEARLPEAPALELAPAPAPVDSTGAPPAGATPTGAQPTRQVNWLDYGKIVQADKRETVPGMAAQKDKPKSAPPELPAETPKPPSKTVHDDLLAAFLADSPLPGEAPDTGEEESKRGR